MTANFYNIMLYDKHYILKRKMLGTYFKTNKKGNLNLLKLFNNIGLHRNKRNGRYMVKSDIN